MIRPSRATRERVLLGTIGATLAVASLAVQMGSDKSDPSFIDRQLAKVGLGDSVHYSEADALPDSETRWTFPRLDAARLEPGAPLTFVLPGGRSVDMPLVERTMISNDALSFIFADPAIGATAEIVLHDGLIQGTVRATFNGRFESWSYATAADGEHYTPLPQSDPCEGTPEPPKHLADEAAGEGGIAGGCADSGSLVDVLVAYTPAIAARYPTQSALQTALLAEFATANGALANSLVAMRYRVAGYHALTTDGSGALNTDLDNITGTTDGVWDDVHAARDAAGADLVALYTDSGGGGVAWLGVGNPAFGFATIGFIGGTVTAHELGHNLGCCHAIGDGGGCNSGGFYAYSNGWRFLAQGAQYRTVMAYDPGQQIPFFSNPDVKYLGIPTGVQGETTAAANNARTHGLLASVVANYRCSNTVPVDCDNDGVPDAQAIQNGLVPDCNLTGIPDSCDISLGLSLDLNSDGIPDECPANDVEFSVTGVAALDTLGSAVGVSSKPGDPEMLGIIGAPGNDAGAPNAGSAYVFPFVQGAPAPGYTLQANDRLANAFFGRGAAVYRRPLNLGNPSYVARDFALVGAYRWTETAPVGTFPSKGALYLFAFDGTNWNQIWRYTPPTTGGFQARENTLFGYSVAMGRNPREGADQIIVGAPGHTNGQGKVYFLRNYFVGPTERAGLLSTRSSPATAADGDNYGAAVALEPYLPVGPTSRVIAVVGSPGRNNAKGGAWVFDRAPSVNGGIGTFPNAGISIAPPGPLALPDGTRYGAAVAISKNMIVVGAPGAFNGRGAVYIWERSTTQVNPNASAYTYRGFFKAPDGIDGDAFGSSVAVSPAANGVGFTIVAGAPKADLVLSTGVRNNAGKVYILNKELGTTPPVLQAIRVMNTPATGDEFGYSASSVTGSSLIGAPFSDVSGLNSGRARLLSTP
jgi:Metallo-peptidase family M12B Reprolysin-like